jgi:tetratricopeptide (TPR) repeat protein
LALDASLEEPRLELIELYKAQGKHESVIDTYRDLLTHYPRNHKAALELAMYYRQLGRPDDGLTLLAEIGGQSRHDTQLTGLVFGMFLETKQYKSAVWVLEGMLAGAPDNSALHYLAGVAHDGLDQLQPTLDHFRQVQTDSRFYPDAVIKSALLYYNSDQADQAIAILEQALLDSPEHADFYYYLGTFHEALRRFDEALAVFNKGLAIDPENVRMRFQIGIVLDELGRREESIEAMKEVVEMAPDHAEALNYLGYTYAEMGIHLAEAEELIRRALKYKPEDGFIKDSMGWVYYKQGDYNTALEWLLNALELVPDEPSILEHLGDVYRKLNQPNRALQFYRRSLEVNPEDRGELEGKIRALGTSRVDSAPPRQGLDRP